MLAYDSFLLFNAKQIRDILKETKPTLINIAILDPNIFTIIKEKNNFGFKIYAESITGTFDTKQFELLFDIYKILTGKILNKYIDGFNGICEGSRLWLNNNFNIPLLKISNLTLGADSKLFAPNEKERKLMRKELNITDNEFVIIYSGKIIPSKDIHVLISSLNHLPLHLKNIIKIVLVGDVDEKYYLYLNNLIKKYHLKNQIIFIKKVNQNILSNYYNMADVAVWPGTPSISILEAMSCGLPIIICTYFYPIKNAYDTRYLLKYNNGYSFLRGDYKELSNNLVNLILNESKRKKMGTLSRKLIENEMNWEKISNDYNLIYYQITNTKTYAEKQ
jgi:glycosyltransferase involved in cell wall biosynthesis